MKELSVLVSHCCLTNHTQNLGGLKQQPFITCHISESARKYFWPRTTCLTWVGSTLNLWSDDGLACGLLVWNDCNCIFPLANLGLFLRQWSGVKDRKQMCLLKCWLTSQRPEQAPRAGPWSGVREDYNMSPELACGSGVNPGHVILFCHT